MSSRPPLGLARGRPSDEVGAGPAAPVVLLTADDDVTRAVLTLAEVAGAVVDRPVLPPARRAPVPAGRDGPALVLVGFDVADPDSPQHVGRVRTATGTVVVVSTAPPTQEQWRSAVAVGADEVVTLPGGDDRLLDRMLDAAAGPPRGAVVGVVGGRGGAGASTLAATLAVAGVRRRVDTLLVDADPWGGGLDLLLGAEGFPGLRWPDLRAVRGRLRPGLLASACVEVDGLRLLTWGPGRSAFDGPAVLAASDLADRLSDNGFAGPVPGADAPGGADGYGASLAGGHPASVDGVRDQGPPYGASGATPEAVRAVLDAARRETSLVVVDVPRPTGAAEFEAVRACGTMLVVVPAEVRAATAAAAVVETVSGLVADVRLVVRGPAPTGLPAEAVADLLGLPLAVSLSPEAGLAGLLDRGEVAAVRPRGPLGRFAARVVAEVVPG